MANKNDLLAVLQVLKKYNLKVIEKSKKLAKENKFTEKIVMFVGNRECLKTRS
jgi:hypothetical protein